MTQYQIPVRATITFANGVKRQVQNPLVTDLFLAFSAETDSASGKTLQNLGGRSEFEKARQKKIIDWLAEKEVEGRKRVMIIGDSIRMRIANSTGYGLHAYHQLVGKANIIHVPHNCGGTNAVLAFLDNWLECKPDLIFINAGLHDLVFSLRAEQPPPAYNSVYQYSKNLHKIIETIVASGVRRVVWGTNTPVQEEWHRLYPRGKGTRTIGRTNADVRLYNEASIEVMKKHDVPIVDMFAPLWEEYVENVLLCDGVHLNRKGSLILAEVVSQAIQNCL